MKLPTLHQPSEVTNRLVGRQQLPIEGRIPLLSGQELGRVKCQRPNAAAGMPGSFELRLNTFTAELNNIEPNNSRTRQHAISLQ